MQDKIYYKAQLKVVFGYLPPNKRMQSDQSARYAFTLAADAGRYEFAAITQQTI